MTLLVLCAVIMAKAQIETNGYWYDGWMCYQAKQLGGGKVLMNAMAEGEEMELLLVPVAGKTGTYRVADGPNGNVNAYTYITTVKHQKKEGWDVLCLYNEKNELNVVMQHTSEENSEKLNISKWREQLMGEYIEEEDMRIRINWDQIEVNGELASYELLTFNGMITPYITINEIVGSVNRFEGTWEIVPTLGGMELYSVVPDREEGGWMREELPPLELKKNISRGSRFAYANNTLLNDRQFRRFGKETMRIMRNSILARHGYRFKSKDLQEYFSKQPWYSPAASNDNIKPSFVEQLNIELIKAAENE